jgi:hypothetical protein
LQAAEKKIQQWVQLLSTPLKQIDIVSNINMAQWNKFILSNAPLFFYGLNKKISIDKMVQQFSIEYHAIEAEIVATVDLSKKILAYEANQTETIITDQVNEKMIATDVTVLAEEKFMVYTSGVVILAPYFKRFFTQLNLLEQGEWKNATAHYKAIQLVRYMATGHLMCPEHSLVLEKLLCGLEINIPIPKEVILSEKEKAEAILLLQAVIANWEQLKNTSVEGLRETFLKRDGILTKKENGWVLQVERKTVDILLDNIPWSFASLAFTWNNYIIFTTW